jgi:hypothetical protein
MAPVMAALREGLSLRWSQVELRGGVSLCVRHKRDGGLYGIWQATSTVSQVSSARTDRAVSHRRRARPANPLGGALSA